MATMNYETYFPRTEEDYLQFKYDVGSAATRHIMHNLISHREGRLLEVGPGAYGIFLSELPDTYEPYGLDVAKATLDSAAKYVGRPATWHLGELAAQYFPENYFDVIVSAHVIEHIEDDAAFIRECVRILKPGGEIVIITPGNLSGRATEWEWEHQGHYRNYNAAMVKALVTAAPGVVLEHMGFYHRILGPVWNRFKYVLHAFNYPFRWFILRDNVSLFGRKLYQKSAPAIERFLDWLDRPTQAREDSWPGGYLMVFRIRKSG